ncbi:ORF095 [Staphylococcus phage 187]|uniref:ORF095 n=1 Tax=Staphylococcus phage 187 TaxID=2908096 RepID=Q4ZE11_9CAUD|nr:ORF095 [Staphylococcus phage 187]AAX90743.1 ORF095 [Staphylococcus phage 187]
MDFKESLPVCNLNVLQALLSTIILLALIFLLLAFNIDSANDKHSISFILKLSLNAVLVSVIDNTTES